MSALFDRIKSWADDENLTNEDLNAEIDNILDNFSPEFMSGFSTNATQMQIQTSPGGVGTESLSESMSDEVERLRYVLSQIIGGTYWYSSIPVSLSSINATLQALDVNVNPRNGIVSGKIDANSQPAFLLPTGGGALTATLKATATAINYWVNGSIFTVGADVATSNLTLAPGTNNTAVSVGDHDEYSTDVLIASVGSNISGQIGNYAAFKVGTEYFIGYVESAIKITRCLRGIFFDSTGANIPSVAFADASTITFMKLAWIYLKSDGTLQISYTNPKFSGEEPSSPASGDQWYDLSTNTWKRHDGVNFVVSDSVLLGYAISDGTGCVAARSSDFVKTYSDFCRVAPKRIDNDNYISSGKGFEVSVNGSTIKSEIGSLIWNLPDSLPAGEAEANDIWYYLYITNSGATFISAIAPIYNEGMRGYYHPAKPWRCIAKAYNATSATSIFHDVVSLIGYSEGNSGLVTSVTFASPGDLIASTKVKCRGGSVLVGLVPEKGSNDINNGMIIKMICASLGAGAWAISIFRNGVEIAAWNSYKEAEAVTTSSFDEFIVGSLLTVDEPGAGEHLYEIYAFGANGANTATISVNKARIIAVEMGAQL